MSNFISRPNKLKAKTIEAKKLGDENRILRMQLSMALAQQMPMNEDDPEEFDCDDPNLDSKIRYAGKNANGHENLSLALGTMNVVSAFKACGMHEILCQLVEIQKINAKAAKGHVAYLKFCKMNCDLAGAEGERQDIIDQINMELDGVDLDDFDPHCAEMINKVLGQC